MSGSRSTNTIRTFRTAKPLIYNGEIVQTIRNMFESTASINVVVTGPLAIESCYACRTATVTRYVMLVMAFWVFRKSRSV